MRIPAHPSRDGLSAERRAARVLAWARPNPPKTLKNWACVWTNVSQADTAHRQGVCGYALRKPQMAWFVKADDELI